jgi:glycosyltransferase involved in cell wall biosynthesis
MRIGFITPEFVSEPEYSGGLANYLGRVTVALAERGHSVHVFTRAHEDGRYDYQGVTVHRVRPVWDRRMICDHVDPLIPRKLYNSYQDFKAAWCLWRAWRRVSKKTDFDVVQVANVSAMGLFFRYERRVPVITRMSSYRPVWDVQAGIPVTLGVRARWMLEKLAVQAARYVYAPSGYVARLVEAAYRIPKVHVIESPFIQEQVRLDTQAYDEFGKGRRYAIFFGRMTQMKGVHILAEALPRALEACPDMEMIIAGPDWRGPNGSSMKDHIRSRLNGYFPRVHILDSMRHDKLYPLIQNARFVVLPSLVDNLPNTCLESMGLGKVVVATTGSCFEDLISHKVSGFLVPPGDAKALSAQMIEAWTTDPATLDQMGRRAGQRVAELHPDRSVPKLLRFYQAVQAGSAKSSETNCVDWACSS